VGFALVAKFGKNLQYLAFKGVVRANNADVRGKVAGGGSVS